MKQIFIIVFISLVATGVSAQSGMDAFNQKRYDAAYRALINDAESGQPGPMFAVGRMFLEGLGSVPKDTNRGISFLARSSDRGYEPATKYLAEFYERSGNLRESVRYYEKLREKGDVSAIKKLVDLNEKVFAKEKLLSNQYCESLESARVLGEKIDELRYATCILEGKNTKRPTGEAIALLRKLSSAGNSEAILILIPRLLAKQGDSLWDPIYAEGIIFSNFATTSQFAQARKILEKADLDHESCALFRARTSAQIQERRAICRLNALKGDQKTVQLVAEGLISGSNGFIRNPSDGVVFASLIADETFKVKLTLAGIRLSSPPDYSQHKRVFVENVSKLDAKDRAINLDFYIRGIFDADERRSVYRTVSMREDSELILKYGDCKNKSDYRKFLETNLKGVTEGRENREALVTQLACSDPQIDRTGVDQRAASEGGDKANRTPPNRSNNAVESRPLNEGLIREGDRGDPQRRTVGNSKELGQLLSQCDREPDVCVDAAEVILDSPSIGSESSRRSLAIDTLEKGAKAGSNAAKLKLVDVLDTFTFPPPAVTQRLDELLIASEKISSDSWTLRRARARVLSLDPISQLLRMGEITDLCRQTRIISLKSELPAVDRAIAARILDSTNCKARN